MFLTALIGPLWVRFGFKYRIEFVTKTAARLSVPARREPLVRATPGIAGAATSHELAAEYGANSDAVATIPLSRPFLI